MVDVGAKTPTNRVAVASAHVRMQPTTLQKIRAGTMAKGDVIGVARLAGIMAAKKTADLIPLCHPLPLTGIDLTFEDRGEETLEIVARVRVFGRTGVEMEALTAVSIAALTIYDMCKAIDRSMSVERIQLDEKSGGASGDFIRTTTDRRNSVEST
jgi:cyclic pyranopterin phosphate synthase